MFRLDPKAENQNAEQVVGTGSPFLGAASEGARRLGLLGHLDEVIPAFKLPARSFLGLNRPVACGVAGRL
jgi:hypothetical protein